MPHDVFEGSLAHHAIFVRHALRQLQLRCLFELGRDILAAASLAVLARHCVAIIDKVPSLLHGSSDIN